jgi:acyl-CoA thioesterase
MKKEYSPEDLKRYFLQDKFARHAGIEIVDIGEGSAKVKMDVKDYHLNGVGLVHGGALFTLADLAAAVAANSRGNVAVGVNCAISYVKPASGKTIYAQAREASLSRRIGTYTVNVTDESGAIVAIFQGTAYRRDEDLSYFEKQAGCPESPFKK